MTPRTSCLHLLVPTLTILLTPAPLSERICTTLPEVPIPPRSLVAWPSHTRDVRWITFGNEGIGSLRNWVAYAHSRISHDDAAKCLGVVVGPGTLGSAWDALVNNFDKVFTSNQNSDKSFFFSSSCCSRPVPSVLCFVGILP